MEYPKFLPGWETVELIGKGGFSRVYKIRKTDCGVNDLYSALKVINIPSSSDEYDQYVEEGLDEKSITTIFREQVKSIVSEFELMSSFRGTANIVSYEDHFIVERAGGKGYTILIRMELLETLLSYRNRHAFNENEIIKVGLDICRALQLCAKKNIVHRDIKPQNIFVNEFGDFKLGDFGIARVMDHTTRATKIGTYSYIPPEVYAGEPYNATADIYSLGIVLYWLLNERRLPFIPLPPTVPTPSINAEAMERRLKGEAVPEPKNGSSQLKSIVLKAIAPNPADRFQTAEEFHNVLQRVMFSKSDIVFSANSPFNKEGADDAVEKTNISDKNINVDYGKYGVVSVDNDDHSHETTPISPSSGPKEWSNSPNNAPIKSPSSPHKTKKSKKGLIVAVFLFVLLAVGVFAAFEFLNDEPYIDSESDKSRKDAVSNFESSEDGLSSESNESFEVAQDFSWSIDDGTLTISGNGAMPDYDSLEDLYTPWYESRESITKVVVEEGINYIGADAFYNLTVLKSAQLPSSVEIIGEWAFYGCHELISVALGTGVKSINQGAFGYCVSLGGIVLPESLLNIQESAFYNCSNLSAIGIPVNVRYIGEEAFSYCDSIIRIIIPDSVTYMGEYAFSYCGSLKSVTIGEALTSISKGAFRGCEALESVSVGTKVTAVDEYAFYDCTSLYSASIPGNLMSIGEFAFYGCESFTQIDIGATVETVGDYAFFGCSGSKSITVGGAVKTIGEFAFAWCSSLETVTLGESVSEIGNCFLLGCRSLESIQVPSANKNFIIEDGVLFDKNKTKLLRCIPMSRKTYYTIPSGVSEIQGGAFSHCEDLVYVSFPDGVTIVGDRAFYGCTYLLDVELSRSVTTINDYAFYDCPRLSNISLPAKLSFIGEEVFGYCSSLKKMEVSSENKYFIFEKGALFTKDKEELVVYLPSNTASYYMIPSTVKIIRYGAFVDCDNLTEIIIPKGVIEIQGDAFADCDYIKEVIIPSTVTKLGEWAFYYCESLEGVLIEGNITSIERGTFWRCEKLYIVGFCSSVTYIGESAFEHCTSLSEFVYGGTMEEWYDINVEYDWDAETPNYKVSCSDGDLTK